MDTYVVENTLTLNLGETLRRLRRHQEFSLFDSVFVSILINISRPLEGLACVQPKIIENDSKYDLNT